MILQCYGCGKYYFSFEDYERCKINCCESYVMLHHQMISHRYAEILADNKLLNKPVRGDFYLKRKKPIGDVDRPAFREMSPQIIVMSQPFINHARVWKYKGGFYWECELFWKFYYYDIKKDFIQNFPIAILSSCYEKKETAVIGRKQLLNKYPTDQLERFCYEH